MTASAAGTCGIARSSGTDVQRQLVAVRGKPNEPWRLIICVIATNSISVSTNSTVDETRLCRLGRWRRYWADFLKADYHPRSSLPLSEAP